MPTNWKKRPSSINLTFNTLGTGCWLLVGIFVFIAFCFLFGLIYGCCGQRSTYYNNDCCSRPTGGKFYGCGVCVALLFMVIFAVCTAVMLLVGANFTNLVCDPWKHPTQRPDMVSFVDRFYFHPLLNGIDTNEDIPKDLTFTKVINKCNEGQSFLNIFGLDKKLQLHNGFSDDLDEFLAQTNLPADFIANTDELKSTSEQVSPDVVKSAQSFESFNFVPFENVNEVCSFRRLINNVTFSWSLNRNDSTWSLSTCNCEEKLEQNPMPDHPLPTCLKR